MYTNFEKIVKLYAGYQTKGNDINPNPNVVLVLKT